MCGLYGFCTKKGFKLTKDQKDTRNGILRGLAIAMQERGTHSTGIACVSNKKSTILKKALPAQEFLNLPEFKELMDNNNRIVIGHTRFATVGEKTDENAHPFEIGNIIGCHNGRISNYASVYEEANVDSEAVFYSINQHEGKLKKAFKQVRGSMALTWLNKKDLERVYFMVDDNPLFLIHIPEIETYFWCSTLNALFSIVGSHFNIKKANIWQPKTDIVYELSTDFRKLKKTRIALQSFAEWYNTIEPEPKLLESTVNSNKKEETIVHNQKEIEDFMKKHTEQNAKWNSINCDLESAEEGEIIQNKTVLEKKELMNDYRIIMNFSNKEIWTIVDEVNLKGCAECDGDIDTLEGFLYLLNTQRVVCMRCSDKMFATDYDNCVFIDTELFEGIKKDAYVSYR